MRQQWLFLLGITLGAAPAFAHHSYTAFDLQKFITIEGVVVSYQLIDPHVQLTVKVPPGAADSAQVGVWDVQGAAANIMRRQGWSATTYKPGDLIKLVGNPLKSGEQGIVLSYAIQPDGKRLYMDISRPKKRWASRSTRMKNPTVLLTVCCWLAAAGDGGCASASCGTTAAAPLDLSGYWVRTDEAGGGSFGGMLALLPKAELQPAAKAEDEAEAAKRQAEEAALEEKEGNVYRVPANCGAAALTFMMQHSGALSIVQGAKTILIVPESPGTQHVFMDGRPHPLDWVPSRRGHSVGHWEGNTLVISTIGLEAGGGVPGGGRKRPETEVVERFTLRDATHLTVTFTWNDPTIYVKPHTYEFTYEKQPDDAYAFESWCDVTDPLQGQSIVIPPQE
jgi:hypothetical protein